MNTIIAAAFEKSRTTLLTLLLLVLAGLFAYVSIPKEADPDVQFPMVYVSVGYEGISPEDADRLLARPIETEMQGLEGVKEIHSVASEGHASVQIEFEASVDIDKAIQDVRQKVDIAKAKLPSGTDEPTVTEINIALFPVLVVTLAGDIPERQMLKVARRLRDDVEALPQVLEVDLAGDREEVLEVVIDPLKIETYGLRLEDVLAIVDRNNRLVAAGSLETGEGRYSIKVPGVFEDFTDVYNLPVKVSGDAVVRLGDIADIRRTFKDPVGFARVNGKPALALEVKKRIGENIIDTIAAVRGVVEASRADWPAGIEVGYAQDKSDNIRSMLKDLENNVLAAILLVMIVVVAALGLRSGLLVGVAVPGSFLAGILVLSLLGYTVNMVVLFGLILATGMLVDGAIVVTELADRKLAEGMGKWEAYRLAATRMGWPIFASTLTTLAAFLPLMFWPGIVGEFMVYLPITLIATLSASLLMALVFVPVLGGVLPGGGSGSDPETMRTLSAAEGGDLRDLKGGAGLYVRVLGPCLQSPILVTALAFLIAVAVYAAYAAFGRGVEFFPKVEPDQAVVQVHARGDLSIRARDGFLREVEARVLGVRGVRQVYARSALQFRDQRDTDEDVVGTLQLELTPWQERPPASAIFAEIGRRTADLAGIRVETREPEAGPPVGKAVQLQITSNSPDALLAVVAEARKRLDSLSVLKDVSDTRPLPGIEWQVKVDRERASRMGADIVTVGATVQLVTNGVMVGTYRPDDAEDEVDIRVRFPEDARSLDQIGRLVVNTNRGPVPLSSFIDVTPAPKTGEIERVDGRRVYTVLADVKEGVLADDVVRELKSWVGKAPIPPEVQVTFRGEDEEQKAASAFLGKAFGVALFLIAIILVTQFNSLYQTLLILSAIVFSTVGVLLGLLVTHQPFGIVMSGIGVIALAGIVVNNNIVLIDTFNELRKRGLEPYEAVLRTCAQRLRPVMLTTVTTILGLMPMVTKINVDFVGREVTEGGPSTDWWAQLATAVAGGLFFATLITLVLTPCLLLLPLRLKGLHARLRRRRTHALPRGAAPAE
ncbi:MAG: efflux RND transporter permease subunit [Geminicoccaceae bacterium]|nr:efflux RND transporter permease subunit [Geminicoccaceae bacterium]